MISSEMRLWRSVVLTAIGDALFYKQGKNIGKYDALDKERAKDWLLRDNKNFYEVCSLAGINPQKLRCKIKDIIASQEQGYSDDQNIYDRNAILNYYIAKEERLRNSLM